MKKIVLICCLFAVSACYAQPSKTTSRDTIVVRASAASVAVADRLSVSLFIENENKSVADAKSAVDQSSEKVINMLLQEGVNKKDLSSYQFNIYPVYQTIDKQRKQTGFRVTRTIQVEIRDWSIFDTLIDQSIELGVNRVGEISSHVSNSEALYLQALTDALENAHKKASLLAEKAGRSLLTASEIIEEGGHTPIYQARGKMMMAEADLSQPGQSSVNASVRVTYTLAP